MTFDSQISARVASNRKELVRELTGVVARTVLLIVVVVFLLSWLPDDPNVRAFGVITGLLIVTAMYIFFS